MLTIKLDANGQVAGRSESKQFNPLDTDPLFTASAMLNGIRYFPSLHGRIQPIDMKTEDVKVLPEWSLVSPEEKAAHWRPSGWQILASDEKSLLYVLMQPNAQEGTHKNPATEVWVFNAATKTRVKRLRLARPGSSLALTRGPEALMLVQAGERLDVYETQGGSLNAQHGSSGLSYPHADGDVSLMTAVATGASAASMQGIDQVLAAQLAAFLAFLLAASATHKWWRWEHSLGVIRNFAGVPGAAAPAAAATVGAVEWLAASLLFFPSYRVMGGLLAATILTVYLALIARSFRAGRRDVDCGCSFGGVRHSLGVFELGRNAMLAAMALFVAGSAARGGPVIAPSQVLGGGGDACPIRCPRPGDGIAAHAKRRRIVSNVRP